MSQPDKLCVQLFLQHHMQLHAAPLSPKIYITQTSSSKVRKKKQIKQPKTLLFVIFLSRLETFSQRFPIILSLQMASLRLLQHFDCMAPLSHKQWTKKIVKTMIWLWHIVPDMQKSEPHWTYEKRPSYVFSGRHDHLCWHVTEKQDIRVWNTILSIDLICHIAWDWKQ